MFASDEQQSSIASTLKPNMTTQGRETVNGFADYNPEELVGSLLESESAERLPLLYFNSPKEAWVRTCASVATLVWYAYSVVRIASMTGGHATYIYSQVCTCKGIEAILQGFWRPVICSQSWLISWFIPGMGMFCEAYFIFSIGKRCLSILLASKACYVSKPATQDFLSCRQHPVFLSVRVSNLLEVVQELRPKHDESNRLHADCGCHLRHVYPRICWWQAWKWVFITPVT